MHHDLDGINIAGIRMVGPVRTGVTSRSTSVQPERTELSAWSVFGRIEGERRDRTYHPNELSDVGPNRFDHPNASHVLLVNVQFLCRLIPTLELEIDL